MTATGICLSAKKVFTKGRLKYYNQTSFAATKLQYEALISSKRNKTTRPHEKSNVSVSVKHLDS